MLRSINYNVQNMTEEQFVNYINCVLEYEQLFEREMERNLEDLADIHNISKEEIKRSQNKYFNNSNSHKLLGREEVLKAKIPKWLTTNQALNIKHEMEEIAFYQQSSLIELLKRKAIETSNT